MTTVKAAHSTEFRLVSSLIVMPGMGEIVLYGIEAEFSGKILRYDDLTEDKDGILDMIGILADDIIDELQFEYIIEDFVQSLYMKVY